MKSNSDIVVDNLCLINDCVKYQTRSRYKTQGFKYYADDLTQEICLQLLEMDNCKLNKILEDNRLNAYITKIIWYSLHSQNSPFYKNFVMHVVKSSNIENYDFVDEATRN